MGSLNFLVLLVLAVSGVRSQFDPHVSETGGAMVHFFEHKYSDILQECETTLLEGGVYSILVSPPHENAVIWLQKSDHNDRPWYERYQPVSYDIASRSGDETEFDAMVKGCRAQGITTYVELVLNHMTGSNSATLSIGTGGTKFNYAAPAYPSADPVFDVNDFNLPLCEFNETENDLLNYEFCRVDTKWDLKLISNRVMNTQSTYIDKLLDIGIAGYRIMDAKHMALSNVMNILSRTTETLNGELFFNTTYPPFLMFDVTDFGLGENGQNSVIEMEDWVSEGYVNEYRYGYALADLITNANRSMSEIFDGDGFAYDASWGFVDQDRAIVFLDDGLSQRLDYLGSESILTYQDEAYYYMANAFMLSWPYGIPKIMSGYALTDDFDLGPPHWDNAEGNIISPLIMENGECEEPTFRAYWICEHRKKPIKRMGQFRKSTKKTNINFAWSSGDDVIAFSRGSVGFALFNRGNEDVVADIPTSMATGTYCDIATGTKFNNICSGRNVTIVSGGLDNVVKVNFPASDNYKFMAIDIDTRVELF